MIFKTTSLTSLLLIAFMVVLVACGGGNDNQTSESQPQNEAKAQDEASQPQDNDGSLQNWRELYRIAYSTSCMDSRLGENIVRKFQTGERGPTVTEFEAIKSCEVERADLLPDNDSRKESSDEAKAQDEASQPQGNDGNLQNWRELYRIAYSTSCMDSRLGENIVRKFQTGERGPTVTEFEAIKSCEVERADLLPDNDSRKESSDEAKAQDDHKDSVFRTRWDPSPDQISCYFSAIGKIGYRAIRAGERLPTAGEIDASRQCMDGTRTLNHVPHSLADEQCPPLDLWNQALVKDRPRWDQLECHMDSLQRLPIPSFRTSARVNPVVLWTPFGFAGCNGTLCPDGIAEVVYGLWDGDIDELLHSMEAPTWQRVIKEGPNRYLDIMRSLQFTESEFPDANASFLPSGDIPPHTNELGDTLPTPLSEYWHDQKLRAYAVHAIQRKQDGHLTLFSESQPATTPPVPASGPSDFRVWVDEVFIPKKIREAKVVEKLKIEMWNPWPLEVDAFIMEQPWSLDLSDSELLDTGQYFLDTVADAVRPHFSGRIIPASFTPGELRHPQHPRLIWQELSFEGFEEVAFTFFPHCDEETTRENLLHDMGVIMEIVERDGISWSLNDWWFVDQRPNECGTDFYDLAPQMTEMMLDILFDQPVPLVGGPIFGLGNIYSAEHKVVLEEKLFSRSDG